MYTPKINYTDKLVANLIKLEYNKTIIQNTDLSYNVKQKLNNYNKTSDLLHLAHILGLELTLKDAEKLVISRKIEGLDDERNYVIANFRNALDFNRSGVADTYAEIDKTVLLHLNKLVITNWRESWDARFRSFHEAIDDRWDSWVSLRDNDIKDETREKEIDELVDWYKVSMPTLTPIVRIGVFLYRLIEICPFVAGNKLTMVAITDYLLLKNGLSSKAFNSIVKHFDLNDEDYLESFRFAKQNHDIAIWLEAFTKKIAKDLIDSREEINKFILEEEKSKKQPFLDLNKRQLKVLKYLQTVPTIKREDYCHMMDVSTMTAFRDLNDLVRKKLLKLEGQGRGTKYRSASM